MVLLLQYHSPPPANEKISPPFTGKSTGNETGRTGDRLDRVVSHLGRIDARLDRIVGRLGRIDDRLGRPDTTRRG